jgi:hypothetical protein
LNKFIQISYFYSANLIGMPKKLHLVLFCLILVYSLNGQTISKYIPKYIDKSKKYLFYLHGGIVQDEGINAVSPDWGKYEYAAILDTLRSYGYNILSEVRPKSTDDEKYGEFIARQVDTLLRSGVPPQHIIIVGASQGASMTIVAAYNLKNSRINYAILGLCDEYEIGYYSKYKNKLCGNFLSIYESSDPHSSCDRLLMEPYCKTGYKQIKLNMGISHGFIFRPYKEWVQPLISWIKEHS